MGTMMRHTTYYAILFSLSLSISPMAMASESSNCTSLLSKFQSFANLSLTHLKIKRSSIARSTNLPDRDSRFFKFSGAVDQFGWTKRDDKILDTFEKYHAQMDIDDAIEFSKLSPKYGYYFLESYILDKKLKGDLTYLQAKKVANAIDRTIQLQNQYTFRYALELEDFFTDYMLNFMESYQVSMELHHIQDMLSRTSDKIAWARLMSLATDYETVAIENLSQKSIDTYKELKLSSAVLKKIEEIEFIPIYKLTKTTNVRNDPYFGKIDANKLISWTTRDELILKSLYDLGAELNAKEIIALAGTSSSYGKRFIEAYVAMYRDVRNFSEREIAYLANALNFSIRLNGHPNVSPLIRSDFSGDNFIDRYINAEDVELTREGLLELSKSAKKQGYKQILVEMAELF
ncbi:hypothetical protein HBN50_03530 [Halobacteriovorax sp. GB3]|uniref:hypothetical protein n=1 Tax=Halobacteriovorax sp. GB3 TaxID=2719615 RepID=UPI0023601698|nr:hypothetical protein [Halobacteriovorax sp. GB3]MDD0852149.1 hypothetical protein [Halobacteriovorax sp. GB3]